MKQTLILLTLLTALNLSAQQGSKNFIDQNYLEVTGTAELDVTPDRITVGIQLSEKDYKTRKDLDDVERKMIAKLQELGIDTGKDLTISDFTSSYRYQIFGSGVALSKRYRLLVHDARMLQRVFFELQQLGISNMNIVKLDHSDIIKLRQDVKVEAVKAAKQKAEALAGAIGQSVGRAIFIQEESFHNRENGMSILSNGLSHLLNLFFIECMKNAPFGASNFMVAAFRNRSLPF